MLPPPKLPRPGVLLPALLLGLGCQTEATPTEDPSQTPDPVQVPTQTPAPEESPLPPAVEWQRVDYGAICPEGQGLDIDGDGGPDNGIYAAIPVLQAWMIEMLGALLQDLVAAGELTPEQAELLLEQMTQLIYEWITLENLSCPSGACGGSEQGGSILALELERLSQAPDLLTFWEADAREGGDVLVPEEPWGSLSGELEPSRQGMFGPGELRLATEIIMPGGTSSQQISVTARDCRALLDWSTHPSSAMVGGGITIVELVDVAEELLDLLVEMIGTIAPIDPFEELEELLMAASDITCSSGEPCYSVCYYLESSPTAVDAPFLRPTSTP